MFQMLLYAVLLKKPEKIVSPEGWPSMIVAYRMYEWFPLFLVFILMKMIFINLLLKTGWMESLKASAAANLVSALTGFLILPLMGFLWDHTLLKTFETLTETYGHFTMASWIGNVFYMALYLSMIEIALIAGVTKAAIHKGFVFSWIFVNLLSLGIVLLTFFIKAPQIGLL